MTDRADKLETLNNNKAAKEMVIVTNGGPFIKALESKIEQLKSTLGVGVEIKRIEDLLEELGAVKALTEPLEELRKTISNIQAPTIPDEVKIKDIDTMINAIKGIKSEAKVTVDWINKDGIQLLTDKLEAITKAVEGQKPDQAPSEFIPTRRVIKVGNRYLFDDSVNAGGGSGGSASPTGVATDPVHEAITDPDTGENAKVVEGAVIVSNARNKFRTDFTATVQPDPTIWTLVSDDSSADGHIVNAGGDAVGSSYLRISLSPFDESSEVSISSLKNFTLPLKFGIGLTMSQRIVGQEVFAGIVSSTTSATTGGAVDVYDAPGDKAITGATISITSNVGTVTITGHGFKGGDRVTVFGCAEPRLNVGPVTITVLTADTFTIPITLANGTYSTTGGYVRFADPFRFAKNGVGYLWENTTVTNASFVSRRNSGSPRILNSTVGTTTATQSNTSPYTDAFNSATNSELYVGLDEASFRTYAADGIAATTGYGKYTQSLPDEQVAYKLQIRARNLKGFTMPVGRITSIAKTGTTTATVITDIAHGLATGDMVNIAGVRDATNFPNVTSTTTFVAGVTNSTTFTVVIGGAVTASSAGGVVWKVQGTTTAPGLYTAQNIQSISRTNNVMTIIGAATWATPLPGEYIHLWGMEGTAAQYDGAYKVLRVSTTTLEVASTGTDFGSISTGGAGIKRTDVRVHFVRDLDYTRLITEVVGGKGAADINNSVPVNVTTLPTLSAVTTVTTVTTVSTVTNQSQMSGFVIKDTQLNTQDRTAWGQLIRTRIT